MAIQLYALAGKNPDIMFSPFVWRVRMALLHKGLDFELLPWRFIEKDRIAAADSKTVPVIDDNGHWVSDSWDIVMYLDEKYPDTPSLLKDAQSRAHAQLVNATAAQVFPAALPIAFPQVHALLDEDNQKYFRETREKMIGKTLEEFSVPESEGKAGLAKALTPFETVLAVSLFLGGDTPTYADYTLFGLLKWLDSISTYRPFEDDTAVGTWFARISDMYDGYAAKSITVRS